MESVMEKRAHRLGWCDPGQAHFWGLDEPAHRCPVNLGDIVCVCPCHQGTDPEQVNRNDREKIAERERAIEEMTAAPKKKRRVVRTPR